MALTKQERRHSTGPGVPTGLLISSLQGWFKAGKHPGFSSEGMGGVKGTGGLV